jgi:hypothetical protein
MALKFPGVYKNQGRFDEQLEGFALEGARLKLSGPWGENKPTDADVKGALGTVFGVGKDENTNIQLLTNHLEEQMAIEQKYQELKDAIKTAEQAINAGGSVNIGGSQHVGIEDLQQEIEKRLMDAPPPDWFSK